MKKAILAVVLCALAAACTVPGATPFGSPEASIGSPANTQATRQYYASLIAGPTPNLSALTLLMTMMPKGGDLHHHYSGAIYAETFLDWIKQNALCVYRADNAQLKIRKFQVPEQTRAELPEAQRALCLDADQVRLSANNAFYRELLSRWSDKDFYNHSHEQVAPDQHFFDTFAYFGNVANKNYNLGLRHLKARAIAENVQYIETMLTSPWPPKAVSLPKAVDGLRADADDAQVNAALASLNDLLAANKIMDGGIEKYVNTMKSAAAGIDDDCFKVRFQTYVSRNSTPVEVFASLYMAFAAAGQGGHVVGVNIVGPENRVVAMRDYSLHMRMFAFLKQKYPAVRLSLHAGELTLGMVPPEGLQSHIREAVEVAGAERIGHGVDIVYEYKAIDLLRTMRERRVAVEINLSSNAFILGVKDEAHPVLTYRHAGVPFVIATDDAGVFRSNLSGEYVLYASRYKPSYDELKETVFNSIRYSFLTDAEKAVELRGLAQRFAEFEGRVQELAKGVSTGAATNKSGSCARL